MIEDYFEPHKGQCNTLTKKEIKELKSKGLLKKVHGQYVLTTKGGK